MRFAIRAELLKARISRAAWGMLALAAGMSALVSGLDAAGAGGTSSMAIPALSTRAGLRDAVTSTGFALLIAAVFGALLASAEFRLGTATNTYIDQPNRRTVLLAKSVVAAIGGLLMGLSAAVITTGIGLESAAAKGDRLAIPTPTIIGYGAGTTIGCALLAIVGVGIGSVIRNQLAATIAIFAWGFVVEAIVGGLLNPLARFLPYTAAAMLAGVTSGGGMPQVPRGVHPLPTPTAVLLLAVIAVVLASVAARTVVRRDIT